jgi:phage major head subunit gpT-like protein
VKDENGAAASVSNFQGGSGTAWYLMDLSRPVKPLVYQKRADFAFTPLDKDDDANTFFNNQYIYGVRGRSNAGFGLWQLAYASKQDLTAANFRDARKALYAVKSDAGRPLGIRPTHLIVPPSLEEEAITILNAERAADGSTNICAGKAELVISHWLEA